MSTGQGEKSGKKKSVFRVIPGKIGQKTDIFLL